MSSTIARSLRSMAFTIAVFAPVHAGASAGVTIVAWGDNTYGQATIPAALSGIAAVAAGDAHTVALKDDGTVVAWGSNEWGQITVPAGLAGVKAIAAGGDPSMALKSDRTVV